MPGTVKQETYQPIQFDAIQIGLASPEKIREWSRGEVKKPETINYRTLKPEKDGLFCEKIFGPSKDWECHCGKYKKIRYKGVVCDRCGVEITKASVRRERMGHIELAAPVSHIWYFKGIPSRMGLILDLSPRTLEKVLYFASYIVLDAGSTDLSVKQVLSEQEYQDAREKYGSSFRVGMGAEAILELLQAIDLEKDAAELKAELKDAYNNSDLFLFMSKEETEGIVILEALAMKIPTLIRDIPVYEGWLTDSKDVYKAKTLSEFETKITGILENKLPSVVEGGYNVAKERDIKEVGKRLKAIYEDALKK